MWSLIATVSEIVFKVFELAAAVYDQARAERVETHSPSQPAISQPEGRASAAAERTSPAPERATYPMASLLRGPLRHKAGQPFARRHPGIH